MTKLLTRARFAAAEAFVREKGRPLDAALLALGLGRGSADDALAALVGFQNGDGGFGHGLEPDLATPASSAIATSVGLRILARLDTPARRPTAVAAIDWLAGTLDSETGVWPIVGKDVELAPHAPWWNWSDEMAVGWNGYRFNPTAEILAHLYCFREQAPAAMLACVEAGLRYTLAETEMIESPYDIKCAIRLAECDGLPPDLARPLDGLVRRSIAAHDPDDAHASPFDAASTPDSPFADVVDGRIEPALTALIAAQTDDGGWPWNPDWDWSFVDKTAGAAAVAAWRGVVTREALETLLAYGRVES
ncbi:MAG TPA: hypothetical protein VN694_02205 [Caulobacteraceae bacterium]|nr:hypothetical protein [Caulobacteraceae bacterium]